MVVSAAQPVGAVYLIIAVPAAIAVIVPFSASIFRISEFMVDQ